MNNWFEVPIEREAEYIDSLRHKVFENAKEEHWKILNELYSYLVDGYNEIPFERAFLIAKKNGIELSDVLDAFGNQIISIDSPHRPKKITLNRLYKFFASKSFLSIRVASEYYEWLRNLKLSEPDKSEYSAKELMIRLIKPGHHPFINIHQCLLDVELIFPATRPTEPTDQSSIDVQYGIGMNVLLNFEKWYQTYYVPSFNFLFQKVKLSDEEGGVYGGRWKVVKPSVGKGGQSFVHVVRDLENPSSEEYALKLLNNYQRDDRFITEIEACKKLDHPNVIKLIDHSALDEGIDPEKRYLVMEYQAGGNLKQRANLYKNNLDSTIVVAKFLAEALKYSHSMGVVHRDVKPENILFKKTDDHDCLISDFGICLIVGQERHSLEGEVVGPRFFMAPELEAGGQLKVQPTADVYSLGKVIFFMISGGEILTREQHRDPQFKVFREGGRHRLLGILLDEMICQETTRIKTMDIVLKKLDEIENWDKKKDFGPDDELKNLFQGILGNAQEKNDIKQKEMVIGLQRQKNYENFLDSFKDWLPKVVDQIIEPLNSSNLVEIKKVQRILPGNITLGAVKSSLNYYVNAYEYGFSYKNLQEGPFNEQYLIFSLLQPYSLGSNNFEGVDAKFIFIPILSLSQSNIAFLNRPVERVVYHSHVKGFGSKVSLVTKSYFGGDITLRFEGKISEWPSNSDKFKEIISEAIKTFFKFQTSGNRIIGN